MTIIRKITIGKDYKDAMHFQLGQDVWKGNVLCDIRETDNEFELFVRRDGGVKLWKRFNKNMGISIEHDITNF